ncbi:hypothetical protein GGF32_009671 [Allomyces javanicus]|nr:hypothetical protein GGF32_009671 [Allomyces javanicus]
MTTTDAPLPASTVDPASTARDAPSSDAATTPKASGQDESKKWSESNTTCCGCIEIRVGVLVLLSLDLILSIFSTVQQVTHPDYAGNTVQLVFNGIGVAFTLWGITSAIQRLAGQFYAFALINMVFVVIDIVLSLIFANVFGLLIMLIIALVPIYFAFVYWQYAVVLKNQRAWENQARSVEGGEAGKPAAPVVAPGESAAAGAGSVPV